VEKRDCSGMNEFTSRAFSPITPESLDEWGNVKYAGRFEDHSDIVDALKSSTSF